ncbi:MAG: GAF and HD-GYP domain-containing protein, partial [Oscillospiraceae bacterium]
DLIVDTAMSLTESDGGTLYIVENNALKFRIVKTRSKGVDMGGNGDMPDFPVIPMNEQHICAYSAITGKSMNIADVYNCTEFDFSGPKRFDCLNDYHTQSMVTIPLQNKSGSTIGVLQLINAQTNGKTREFTAEEERIIHALGSQTAIALENMEYLHELNEQMWSFTEALTEAIDKRTPYNASHTRKVAEYSGMLADYINQLHERGEEAEYFDEERRNQLIMSALLHDIGKLVIPKSVMNKATRLGDKFETVMSRLREIKLRAEIAFLKNRIIESEFNTISERVKFCIEFVEKLNAAGFVDDETEEKLGEIAEYSFDDGEEKIKFFTEEELEMLKIKRGTLSEGERKIMESHALMTEEILKKVHFNSSFKNAGKWAAQHHECLNGKGYPYGLTAEDLCLEVRILAVADICDALLATDRPYKKPMPKEKAFEIMHAMADDGKIERRLVDYLEICLGEL